MKDHLRTFAWEIVLGLGLILAVSLAFGLPGNDVCNPHTPVYNARYCASAHGK